LNGPTKAKLALLAAVVGTTAVPATAQEFRRLNAAEIRTKVIGHDLTDDYHWTEFYRRDGRLEIEDLGHRKTGRWHIERDMLCSANAQTSPLRCWKVWHSGTEISLRVRPDDQTPPTFLRRHQEN
jgi:hypothetical protein